MADKTYSQLLSASGMYSCRWWSRDGFDGAYLAAIRRSRSKSVSYLSEFGVLGKNSPGTTRDSPKTISAGDALRPSLGVVRKPDRTQGRCDIQSWPEQRAVMAALRVRWLRSTMPLACGW